MLPNGAKALLLLALVAAPASCSFLALEVVGMGQYNLSPALFLAPTRRISPSSEVLPVPIMNPNTKDALNQAMELGTVPTTKELLLACQSLVNRDDGLYDNMPWEWGDTDMAKRDGYRRLTTPRDTMFMSPYHVACFCLAQDCKAKLLDVFIERVEERGEGDVKSIVLGGALAVERLPETVSVMGETIRKPFTGGEQQVIDCANEEAVGIALAVGGGIKVATELFEIASVPASFIMEDGKMRIGVDLRGPNDISGPRSSTSSSTTPPHLITVASFKQMKASEKRAVLRSVSIRPPRMRLGVKAVDDLLLPLLDEAVRRQILTERAMANEDFRLAAELSEGKSERQLVKEGLTQALKDGDFGLASTLKGHLEALDAGRADITQDEGSYQRDLDADEWYTRSRRSSMGID